MKKWLMLVAFCIMALPVFGRSLNVFLISGPFAAEYDGSVTGLEYEYLNRESTLAPRPDSQWKEFASLSEVINLEDKHAFDYHDNHIAYAYIEIIAPAPRRALLHLGSDDGLKVWLNGRNILTQDLGRGLKIGEDRLNIMLNQGVNRLLLKISDVYGGWSFSAQITDMDGNDFIDLEFFPKQQKLTRIPVHKISYTGIQNNDTVEFSPAYMVDAKEQTRWASDFSDIQSLTFDFGARVDVTRMVLLWENAFAKEYEILVSNVNREFKQVLIQTDGRGGREDHILKDASGRYLKLDLKKRGTRWGYSLFEVYFYGSGPDIGTAAVVPEIEKDMSIKPMLAINQYPRTVYTNSRMLVDLAWNDAPSSWEYKLVVQLENWDVKPGICIIENIEMFSEQGSQQVIIDVPAIVPSATQCRVVAAFISKTKGWDDTFYSIATAKDISIIRP